MLLWQTLAYIIRKQLDKPTYIYNLSFKMLRERWSVVSKKVCKVWITLCFLFCRFWVLWDECKRQHQCQADVRTSRRPNLWQDVWELGHWSGCHHGSPHRQTDRQRSTPPAAWMQLLVAGSRKLSGQESAGGPRSARTALTGLQFKACLVVKIAKAAALSPKRYHLI